MEKQIKEALEIAFDHGQTDGDHHKAWVIDQMVRKLLGLKYKKWIREYMAGKDGENTYDWDVGIAP